MEPVYKNLGKVRPTVDKDNWSIDKEYDLLTIVYDLSSNKSYVSRKNVPANVIIDNREYWLPFGVGKFVDNAIININYLDGVSQELVTYTLEEAIARIGDEDKRLGVIISFYGNEASDSHTPGWCLYQFMSNDLNDWDNINAWNSIYYNRNKNVGWFRTESELLAIYPSPHKGDYCYIGTSLLGSFVYRCYENGTWVNTNELASANIGIVIGGNIRISENGTWIVDDEDTGIKAIGTGIKRMTYTPSQEDGGINILQVKLTDGTQFSFPIKNGNQGNSGIVVPDLETFLAELVNNLTTDDATKGLSAAQGVVLNNKISQLRQETKKLTTLFEEGVCYDVNPSLTKYSKVSDETFASILTGVSKGDVFSINGIGGSSYRLWATCAVDGTIIRRCDANKDATTISGRVETVTIEDGENILIVNTFKQSLSISRVVNDSVIQKSIMDIYNELHTSISDVNTSLSSKQDKESGYMFAGIVFPNSTPTVVYQTDLYCYVATAPGTYVNCGNLVVNKGEVCIFRRTPVPNSEPTWTKTLVARQGIRIVAAYDSSDVYKAMANRVSSYLNDGISAINGEIAEAKDGETIVLCPGTYASTNSGVAINKNINILGFGLNTVIQRGDDGPDIFIGIDNISATVKNINVTHCVRINPKNSISYPNSSLYVEQIYVNNNAIDCELINEVYRNKYPTLGHPNSIYKWYGTYVAKASNPLGTIIAFTSGTSFVPASQDINDRTLRLLPGEYIGIGGVYFNKSYPFRLMGFKGHEEDTVVKRTSYSLDFPNDIYISGDSAQTDKEIRIENLTVGQMVNFSKAINFHIVNCYRDGIRLDDYNASNVLEVGKNKTFSILSHALQVAKGISVNPTKRILIKVYGEIRDYNICECTEACIDIEGYEDAVVMRIGNTVATSNHYGSNQVLRTAERWDGYIKNLTIKLVGVFKDYSFPALNITGTKKALFENVTAYQLTFAGKGVPIDNSLPWNFETNALRYRFDQERRCVRCVADENSSTGYTAHIYDPMWGTEIGTYECTAADAAAAHPYAVTVRRPDSEMPLNPEDTDGGRRYGIYVSVPNECDVKLINCHGYGSPWGGHNTRGIYVDYGSPTLINCIGISGGIGTRLCGIIFHRDTEAEAIGCIGYASPFAYYGENISGLNNFESVGIKFQAQAASKISNCIGYGNDQPLGHGIHCDMKVYPNIINCMGYTDGGEDAAGFCIEEYATVNLIGGYYGNRKHSISRNFINNNGNGMNFYPYRRPVRHDESTDAVVYANHWAEVLDNTQRAYKILSLMFSCNPITSSSALLNKYVRFYDMTNSDSSKTLIAECKLALGSGSYYYVNFKPYATGNQSYTINTGHHLYIAIEEEDGTELTTADGILSQNIQPTVVCTDVAKGQSGVFIWQYRSRHINIDPTNPPTPIVNDTLISGVTADSNGASIRIGAKADIAARYNVVNSTLRGDIVRDTATANAPRIYNSVKIVGRTVTLVDNSE